ncbi:MAG: hypothetical protein RIC55_01855 [Pirellulaceae bacterium]
MLPPEGVSDRCVDCLVEATGGETGELALRGGSPGELAAVRQAAGLSRPAGATAQIALSGPVAAVLNNRLLVVAILLVAGPIGLPALWLSPRFSRVTKAVCTIGFFLATVVLPLAGAWYAFEILLRPLADAIEQANPR